MLAPLYDEVAECDYRLVQLEEYDALLREWLRQILKKYPEKTIRGIAREATATRKGGKKKVHAPDLTDASNDEKNVSKEMFVGIVRACKMEMSEAFGQLSVLAARYAHGDLELNVKAIKEDVTVSPEHAEKRDAVAIAMSKQSGSKKTKSKPAPQEKRSEESDDTSPRKS